MLNPRNGNERLEALIEQTTLNNAVERDSQVKGRVLTSRGPLASGFFVKQEIDGVTTAYQTYASNTEAAEDFVTLRAHARRNLHEYLSSVRPESSYKE